MKLPLIGKVKFKRNHPYVNGFRCYAGSAWMNLSRKAIERLWARRALVDSMTRYLKNTSVPDETLFQTVLGNDPELKILDTNKRFIVWKGRKPNPENLGLEYWEEIMSSPAWFARKFDNATSAELIHRLDKAIGSAA